MDALLTLVTLLVAIVNAVLPTDTVIEYFFPRPEETVTDETYSSKKKFLTEDYRRFNPAYKEEEIAAFTRSREAKIAPKEIEIQVIEKEKPKEGEQENNGESNNAKNPEEKAQPENNGLNIE